MPNDFQGTPEILPRPDFHFPGEVGRTYIESDPPRFPQPTKAPHGAPNVVLIVLDDVGFGQFSTFGGGIPSPTMDRLAEEGIRFNRFHTTALCSPTRAALITGRNHQLARRFHLRSSLCLYRQYRIGANRFASRNCSERLARQALPSSDRCCSNVSER